MLRSKFLRDWREQPPGPLSFRYLSVLLGLAAVYFAAGKLGLALAFVHPSATAVWAPSGIALAAFLLLGQRVWPAVFLGALLVNLTTAGTVLTSLGIAAGNTAEGVLGAWLVNRFAGGLQVFERSRSVSHFIFFAAMLSTAVSATVGVITLMLGGQADWTQFGSIWLTWWLGDAAGDIIVAPPLLLGVLKSFPRWDRRKAIEAGLVGLTLLGVSLMAFSDPASPTRYAFATIPVLLWVAFRFDKLETTLVVLLLSGFAIGELAPGAVGAEHDPLLLVQAFVAIVAAMTLGVSAVVSERRQTERELRNARDELAGKVRLRETLLARAEKLARTGSFEWDAGSDRVRWSDQMCRIYGREPEEFGGTIEAFLSYVHPEDREKVRATAERAVHEGQSFRMRERIVRPDGEIRVLDSVGEPLRDPAGRIIGLSGACRDVTEEHRADVALGELSGRILRVQDEERRRIARELHDSTSPLVTGLIGKLYKIKRQLGQVDAGVAPALEESLVLAEHVAGVIRNTASLLHPAILDQNGLQATLRWYLDAFAKRAPIRIDTRFAENRSRLPRDAEIALFRVVEESLTNVLRHSGGKTARVCITESNGALTLEVTDDGHGVPAGTLASLKAGSTVPGVGVWTMAERMKQVGGRLTIDSGDWGTTVKAILPTARAYPPER